MNPSSPPKLQIGDLAEAMGLLTRFPIPQTGDRGIAAAWAWPLAGLSIGLSVWLGGYLAFLFGLPSGMAAAIALAMGLLATGALHEDGLADCADGFWGGATAERRLEIMKDSRIGSYGVLALIIVVGLRWQAFAALMENGWFGAPILAAAALSRVPMIALMRFLPNARQVGLSASYGAPKPETLWLGTVVALIAAILMTGFAGLAAALAAALVAVIWARIAKKQIGGQTGDVLGASQQLSEIAALAVFVALIN